MRTLIYTSTRSQLATYLQTLTARQPARHCLEIRYPGSRSGMARVFVGAGRGAAATRTIEALAARTDVYIGVLPRTRHAGGRDAVAAPRMVWAEIDRPDAVERLLAFPHPPTMIVRSGTRGHAHAYWQLREPTTVRTLERANRRLAHALGGDPVCFDAARILRPPGTLNHKHTPATPVILAAHRPDARYDLAELAGDLEDPPGRHPRPLRHASPRTPRRDVDAQLLAVPAAEYAERLTGRQVGRDGKIACPFHDDHTPSCHLYDDGTFYCFGCGAGGSVYDFAAQLWDTDTKGRAFLSLRDRLRDELLGART